ncbi:MAG TPA: phosphatase PAP2 family protein [Acidimicrobiales bacterium]
MTARADIERPDGTEPADEEMRDDWRTTTIAGGALVVVVVVVALIFRWHPGPNFLDNWGFSWIHSAFGNSFFQHMTDLRSWAFILAGSILAALVVYARDRLRALACLIAPTLAILLVELLLKPVIGRRYAQVLSFPSGTTTIVASVVTAWALAVPRRIRPAVVIVGTFVIGLECISVIALRWHFPTDSLGGVIVGVGTVLMVDGLLHLAFGSRQDDAGQPAGSDGTRTADATGATDMTDATDASPS